MYGGPDLTSKSRTSIIYKMNLALLAFLFLGQLLWVNSQYEDTPLHVAARSDDVETLKSLLDNDPDQALLLNKRGGDQQTALFAATLAGSENAVKYLLAKGAKKRMKNSQGYFLIDAAAFQGRASLISILVENGFDPKYMHNDGFTPIHRACWGREDRHTKTVLAFLEAGVPADIRDRDGLTPLETTKNEATKKLLKRWIKKGNNEEYDLEDKEEEASEL